MAKKRVFLDECCGDGDLKICFPLRSHVYVTAGFGIRGREDTTKSLLKFGTLPVINCNPVREFPV
jgi:hypothetical protein